MLSTTLRQLVSISGRAILAIGLTSATVFALAPSAKADDVNISVTNPAYFALPTIAAGDSPTPPSSTTGIIAPYVVKKLTVQSNKAFTVSVTGSLKLSATVNTVLYEADYTLQVGTQSSLAKAPTATAANFYEGTATEALAPIDLNLEVSPTSDFRKLPPADYTGTITVTATQNQ